MRLALPLIYCVPDDVKAKLLGRITGLDSVPELWWKDWPAEKCEQQHCYLPKGHDGLHQAVARIIDIGIDYDKFMRQKPHSPVRVK